MGHTQMAGPCGQSRALMTSSSTLPHQTASLRTQVTRFGLSQMHVLMFTHIQPFQAMPLASGWGGARVPPKLSPPHQEGCARPGP